MRDDSGFRTTCRPGRVAEEERCRLVDDLGGGAGVGVGHQLGERPPPLEGTVVGRDNPTLGEGSQRLAEGLDDTGLRADRPQAAVLGDVDQLPRCGADGDRDEDHTGVGDGERHHHELRRVGEQHADTVATFEPERSPQRR